MSNKVFRFGETMAGYDQPVLNEREVRAAAGILFFFAIVSFLNAWLIGNFQLTRVFVIAFLSDFTIRIFINPSYAPSMVLGRLAVSHQAPEWAGAPQKRFAWSIALALAVAMLYLVVINRIIGPINLVICSVCLLLLFFESAFGICLACVAYNAFHRERARHCPGGVCEVDRPKAARPVGAASIAILVVFAVVMAGVTHLLPTDVPGAGPANAISTANPDAARCRVPDWAKAMGHEEMWKLHNNCK